MDLTMDGYEAWLHLRLIWVASRPYVHTPELRHCLRPALPNGSDWLTALVARKRLTATVGRLVPARPRELRLRTTTCEATGDASTEEGIC